MKRITTGIENFKEFMDKNYYYVDKTMLIDDVLSDKVMLYTRPRRFGKTLNMSMLYYFFSNQEKENAYLFDNLNVSKHQHLMIHQNQYPVIFLSLKDMNANTFQSQIYIFANLITSIIDKYADIQDSNFISDRDKNVFQSYSDIHLNINELRMSLKDISSILFKHYHQKVIILIDEYDVPLQSAYQHGYYDEMVDFIRSVFSSVLKTNDALERGVLTGCLRISKESIFTGLNNFTVRTIMDVEASDCFGFTQEEIDELLKYYNLMDKRQEMKEWFNSYQRKRDSSFIEALIQEDVMKANRLLQDVLQQSISYYDNYENFYHGFMVGFLKANGYTVQSNKESGEGRFDIAVLPYSILDTALIIECKHSSGIKELRIDSAKASEQIIRQKYIEGLIEEGYEHVIGYGISFYKKQCIITKAG